MVEILNEINQVVYANCSSFVSRCLYVSVLGVMSDGSLEAIVDGWAFALQARNDTNGQSNFNIGAGRVEVEVLPKCFGMNDTDLYESIASMLWANNCCFPTNSSISLIIVLLNSKSIFLDLDNFCDLDNL